MRPDQPIAQMFSARAEFPSQWHTFLRPAGEDDEQVLRFTIGSQRLLFLARDRNVVISRIELFARSTRAGNYFRARYYNSRFHRFIAEDPLGLGGGDTNLYAYARNDPVNSTDPTGLGQSYDNWLNKCLRLEETINNLRKSILKRSREWEENPQALDQCHPGGKITPFWSTRGGHAVVIALEQSLLRAAEKAYGEECGGPPPTPVPVVENQPSPQTSSSAEAALKAAAVVGGLGAVGTALWWIAKPLAVFCGPVAPACVVVL
jgi:RHS repeat-associated protein